MIYQFTGKACTMKLLSFFIYFLFPFISNAQLQTSLTLGVSFFDFETYAPIELREREVYLKPKSIKEKINLTGGIRFKSNIGKRFTFNYQVRAFIKKMNVEIVPTPSNGAPPFIPYRETENLMNLSNSVSFSMKINNNFNVGIGGFYSLSNTYPRSYGIQIWKYGAHQGGFLVTTSYIIKKWTFEARMLRGIGDAFIRKEEAHRFMKSANSYELSVSYRIFNFTIKKGKNIKK